MQQDHDHLSLQPDEWHEDESHEDVHGQQSTYEDEEGSYQRSKRIVDCPYRKFRNTMRIKDKVKGDDAITIGMNGT